MKKVLLLLLLTLVFAYAEKEDYYLHLALGTSQIALTPSNQTLLAPIESNPNYTHVQVGIDIGVYLPVTDNIIMGYAMSGVGDSYQNTAASSIIQMNYYLYALSTMYYISDEIKGFYLRFDIGSTKAVLQVDGQSAASPSATGTMFGIGYKFSSITLELSAHNYTIDSEQASSFSTLIGVIW